MRRKPINQGGSSSGGYNNNQQRKPRFQQGGSSHNNHHNNNRPRKNYAPMREKYLAQARDALAAGDRVLAENYFQHADHCYRMMVEEGYQVRNNYTPPPGEQGAEGSEQVAEEGAMSAPEEHVDNVGQLPAFLTTTLDTPQGQTAEPVQQNWEE